MPLRSYKLVSYKKRCVIHIEQDCWKPVFQTICHFIDHFWTQMIYKLILATALDTGEKTVIFVSARVVFGKQKSRAFNTNKEKEWRKYYKPSIFSIHEIFKISRLLFPLSSQYIHHINITILTDFYHKKLYTFFFIRIFKMKFTKKLRMS